MFSHLKVLKLSFGTSTSTWFLHWVNPALHYLSHVLLNTYPVLIHSFFPSVIQVLRKLLLRNKYISQLSFYFQCNTWCSLLYLYDLQVRAGDNFLMCRHLMVAIILSRFFCFINIGYQFCKVIVMIISCTNNTYIALCSILCNISISSSSSSSLPSSLSISWNWYHFAFTTSVLCRKYWFGSAAWQLSTLPFMQTLHRNPYSLINIPLGLLVSNKYTQGLF